jgi:putative NADPH-quinone reductase
MTRRILILDGHPDPRPQRLGHALADAYAGGAVASGHAVRRIALAGLDLPLITSADAFAAPASSEVLQMQADITWSQHLVLVHPLWLGAAPAVVKGVFEQVFRYGFALSTEGPFARPLKGRSARLVVTMGMPALAYRAMFGAFGVRGLERSVLNLAGIWPVRRTLLGGVGAADRRRIEGWLQRMRALGAAAR